MEKKNIKKIMMTNKEMAESVLTEIENFGYHIKEKEFGNCYFFFEDEEDSICHFHIKEIPGFKFALWNICRYDDIEEQIKKSGVGWTWADSLNIDPRSDIVFFTQYERDIDKFKPSRSGFVWGLYRDRWQEENDNKEMVTVEAWRDLYELERILTYMKKHRYKAIEHCGRQSRYIWEDNISSFKAFLENIHNWNYEYKSRFKDWCKDKIIIRQSKHLLKQLKMSYGVLMQREQGWYPKFDILIRRKENINLDRYIREQELIDTFEDKHWGDLDLQQYDIDITSDNLTDEDLKADKEAKTKFIDYVNNIGKEQDDGRKILYKNMKEVE